MTGWPSGSPPELVVAAAAHRAEPVRHWTEPPRGYVELASPAGELFARYSSARSDRAVLAHEAAVRELIGAEGSLRAPPVIARGASWLLERRIAGGACHGPEAIDAVVAAAAALPGLSLPFAPRWERRGGRPRRLWYALRLLASPVPARDLVLARRLIRQSRLPPVASHGDFHPGNVLVVEGAAWVVDWEHSGRRPAGYDLMHLWSTLDSVADRARVFDGAVSLVGEAWRDELARLRYAMVVQTIAGNLAAPAAFDRDPAGGAALLALLPELRASLPSGAA